MTPEAILAHPPVALRQTDREFYFEQGYLLLPAAIPSKWLERLRAAANELIERSRSLTRSDTEWSLEPDHTAEAPRLRRATNPPAKHPTFWEFSCESMLLDIVADIVGPDVKFVECQLNFKWAKGGAEIKWHQDIPFTAYTNYSQTGFGLFLEDVTMEQGPMAVIPGSHKGPIYDHYDEEGRWVGYMRETDLARIGLDRAVYLTGAAGTLQIHNCRTVHGSKANTSNRSRPLLINHYCSADSFHYTSPTVPDPPFGRIVRGKPARWAHHDPRPCLIPPDWSQIGGYETVFAYQQREDASQGARARNDAN